LPPETTQTTVPEPAWPDSTAASAAPVSGSAVKIFVSGRSALIALVMPTASPSAGAPSMGSGEFATIDYLDSIGGFEAIVPYERALGQRFLDGISEAVTVYGLPGMAGRVPTFLVNVDGVAAEEVAARRGDSAAS
jgi:hypothetical protein